VSVVGDGAVDDIRCDHPVVDASGFVTEPFPSSPSPLEPNASHISTFAWVGTTGERSRCAIRFL